MKSFGVVKKRPAEEEMVDFKSFNIEELLMEKVSACLYFENEFWRDEMVVS